MYETYSDSVRAEGRLTWRQVQRILADHSASEEDFLSEVSTTALVFGGSIPAVTVLDWLGY